MLVGGTVKRLFAVRLVVKFVRACRLLPWLVEEFPGCRFVYLVRSPYAVVSSQLSRGASAYLDDRARPYDYLNEAKQPKPRTRELCDRIRADAGEVLDESTVREIDTLEGCLSLSWYADNFVAQRAAAGSEAVLTIKYEDLLTDTTAELERIYTHAGVEGPPITSVHVKNPKRQLRKWKEHLSDRQVELIRTALQTMEGAHGSLTE